jgi:hypothetical protein
MLCDQVREHLSAYLDKELTADLSAAVRGHLDTCAECRALADDLRATVNLLGRLPAHAAPGHLADDVMREIERRGILAIGAPLEPQPQERTLPMRRARLWPRALAVAATLVLAVGIGIFAYMSNIGRQASPAPESAVVRKAPEASKASEDFLVATSPKPADPADGYGLRQRGPADKMVDRLNIDADLRIVAADKKAWGEKAVPPSFKESKGEASPGYSLAARGADAEAKEPAQAAALAKAGNGAVTVNNIVTGGGVVRNGGARGKTLNLKSDPGQITLDFNGTTANDYTGGTAIQLEGAAVQAATLYAGMQVDAGFQAAQLPESLMLPFFAAPPLNAHGSYYYAQPAAPGFGGRVYPGGGTITLAGAPAKVDSTPKLGAAYLGMTVATVAEKAAETAAPAVTDAPKPKAAPGFLAEAPVAGPAAARPTVQSTEEVATLGDIAESRGRPASKPAPTGTAGVQVEPARDEVASEVRTGARVTGKAAAAKARGLDRGERATLEKVMTAAAEGEGGVEQLSRAATGDALRTADNQLVLRVDSPDEADRNLVELFKDAGWHALAVDRQHAALKQEAAVNGRWSRDDPAAPRAEQLDMKKLAPGGVYYRATRNGENVWLVLADRDSISRFGSRLAQAQGLTVADGSSAEFLPIRGLQEQLRESQPAKANEPALRLAGGKGPAPEDLAQKEPAPRPVPAMKPTAGAADGGKQMEGVAAGEPAVPPSWPMRGKSGQTAAPAAGPPVPATPAATAAPAPAAVPAESQHRYGGQAPQPAPGASLPVAAASQPKKPSYSEQEGGRKFGISGGGGAGGAPVKDAAGLAGAKAESKLQMMREASGLGQAPTATEAAQRPPDRILLVIRVQPVLADRAEVRQAVPAATQPAEKPAP